MSIELSGDEWFPIPPGELFEKLTDFDYLVRCFPDVAQVVSVEPDRMVFKVKPGFSFIKGTIENVVEFTEKSPPVLAVLKVEGKGIGSSIAAETRIQLQDWLVTVEGGSLVPGSKVHWETKITQLGGLLKAVSKGLLEAAAEKTISVAWSKFRKLTKGEIA